MAEWGGRRAPSQPRVADRVSCASAERLHGAGGAAAAGRGAAFKLERPPRLVLLIPGEG